MIRDKRSVCSTINKSNGFGFLAIVDFSDASPS
jgi:hypothetical protein